MTNVIYLNKHNLENANWYYTGIILTRKLLLGPINLRILCTVPSLILFVGLAMSIRFLKFPAPANILYYQHSKPVVAGSIVVSAGITQNIAAVFNDGLGLYNVYRILF